ncbi:MAG: 30S ribosomal protein S12 methylthiotransferase RimO [Thermodesulfobacteriota bacterium]|nr:30S ribosomal protein S12 methylthiotransferase RimO [Thermodesulfobacteriota bacterium]
MKTFSVISLGCSKNLIDSEYITERLIKDGYALEPECHLADMIIVNTCAFLRSAVEESIETLLEVAQDHKKVVCTGCLVSRYKEDLLKDLPEIDLFAGPGTYDHLVKAIEEGQHYLAPRFDSVVGRSFVSTPGFAYVKISEGCSNHCHFCLIPSLRGEMISRKPEDIVDECKSLVDNGTKEICLVAQDLGAYGQDRTKNKREYNLVDLVTRIGSIKDLGWLRLMYMHPESLSEELVETIHAMEKVCNYIDMPIQHVSSGVLAAMGRKGGKRAAQRSIDLLKKHDIWLRSTIMVGHPGEDEAAFNELRAFISRGYIDSLGVFTYSPESGTPSARMKARVGEETKQERKNIIMGIQQGISRQSLEEMKGRQFSVLLEGYHPETDLLLKGRTSFQAPEVDGSVIINDGGAPFGSMVRVEITASMDYDLIGGII